MVARNLTSLIDKDLLSNVKWWPKYFVYYQLRNLMSNTWHLCFTWLKVLTKNMLFKVPPIKLRLFFNTNLKETSVLTRISSIHVGRNKSSSIFLVKKIIFSSKSNPSFLIPALHTGETSTPAKSTRVVGWTIIKSTPHSSFVPRLWLQTFVKIEFDWKRSLPNVKWYYE